MKNEPNKAVELTPVNGSLLTLGDFGALRVVDRRTHILAGAARSAELRLLRFPCFPQY